MIMFLSLASPYPRSSSLYAPSSFQPVFCSSLQRIHCPFPTCSWLHRFPVVTQLPTFSVRNLKARAHYTPAKMQGHILQQQLHQLNNIVKDRSISKLCIFIYVVAVTIHGRHDGLVWWGLVGAIINDLHSKLLKRMIKQPRPGINSPLPATPDELGMPSNHAQNVAFLSVYTALGGFLNGLWTDHIWLRSFFFLSIAVYVAALRVIQGKHTPSQVIAGGLLGGASATIWLLLCLLGR